jgi:hypothetical protein
MALEDEELVALVLDDLDAAPVDDRLRATLRVLARLTRDPERFGAEDLAEARRLGASDAALADAISVCALFNVATRCADALHFDLDVVNPRALIDRGYHLRPPAVSAPAEGPAPQDSSRNRAQSSGGAAVGAPHQGPASVHPRTLAGASVASPRCSCAR